MTLPKDGGQSGGKADGDPNDPAKQDPGADNGEAGNQEGSQGAEDGEEFDKDRALETIRKQREAEKKAKDELKAAQARLKALEDAEQKRKDAELSELERAQKRVAELEATAKEAQELAQALRLRQAFGASAAKSGLSFISPQAEDDAFDLADLEGVEVDSAGKVTGIDDALKALQKARPYLFKQETDGGNGTPKRGRTGSGGQDRGEVTAPKINF